MVQKHALLCSEIKMTDEELHIRFKESVEYVSNFTHPLPADLLLKLYAYYKIASKNHDNPGSKTPLINAFKANALIQAQNISVNDAMKNYIELVDKEVKKIK